MDKELFQETFYSMNRMESKIWDLEKENKELKEKIKSLNEEKKELKESKTDDFRGSFFHDIHLRMYREELFLKAKKIKELESKIKEYEKPTMDLCECGD